MQDSYLRIGLVYITPFLLWTHTHTHTHFHAQMLLCIWGGWGPVSRVKTGVSKLTQFIQNEKMTQCHSMVRSYCTTVCLKLYFAYHIRHLRFHRSLCLYTTCNICCNDRRFYQPSHLSCVFERVKSKGKMAMYYVV